MFNHESPRRGETFVTRKVTRSLCRISFGLESCLYVGNLNSLRDWGHAKDYVEMQWRMLQQKRPEDFVIATGKQISVRRFIELAANKLGWNKNRNSEGIIWSGDGVDEVGKRADTGEIVVRIDQRYFRPTEVATLLGDPIKAKNVLGWEPKISLEQLIEEMIEFDKEEALKESLLKKEGFKVFGSIENPPNTNNKQNELN